MIGLLAITKREAGSYFRTSIGWVVIALFLLLAGALTVGATFMPGSPASLRMFFSVAHWVLLVMAPAIAMRLVAEERRAGTIEPLLAAPVSEWTVVIGKYLGAVLFLLATLAPTLVYVALLEAVADPDMGPIIAGYCGLVLAGMLYIAGGLLASCLTHSQVIAYLATLIASILLLYITGVGAQALGPPFDGYLYALSIQLRIDDFAKGVIDTAHIVYFLAVSAWLVVLAAVSLEFRRWR